MGTDDKYPVLFALFGLNRAGRILYITLFCLAVPAWLGWTVLVPRLKFSDEDERLFRAARHGDVAGIERSLDAGADVNRTAPIDGKSALFRAAVFGHADAVRVLLKRGADPIKPGNDGHTALDVVTAAMADEHDRTAAQALEAVAGVLREAASKR